MLVTNIATFVLILVLLTVVPLLPGIVMSRYLSTGLATDPAERADSVRPMMWTEGVELAASGRK